MQKRYLLLPCLLLAFALALSACGGGSSSSGSGDESQIEEVIANSTASTEPSACTEFETRQFMEQSTSTEGPGAVGRCEENVEEQKEPETAETSEIEVEGEEATAEVAITGGGLGGQAVEVALVKEGGDWKMNELVGFTELDKGALAKSVGSELRKQGGGSAELAPCIEESFEEADQAEIEELTISGSSTPIEELAEECQG